MNCNSYRYLVVKELFLAARQKCQKQIRDAYLWPGVEALASAATRGQQNGRPSRSCGDEGDRTPDLVVANHALSQLSYIPD